MSVPESGGQAHAEGHPMSACPWQPNDPEGMEWRTSWIRAESTLPPMASTGPLAVFAEAFNEFGRSLARAIKPFLDAMSEVGAALAALDPGKDKPRRVHKPCPIHGDTSRHGGTCQPCARVLTRRTMRTGRR